MLITKYNLRGSIVPGCNISSHFPLILLLNFINHCPLCFINHCSLTLRLAFMMLRKFSGQTKIPNFNDSCCSQEYVVRLKISVDKIVFVNLC
jgi:hypothetical protein